jgi:hypothetical protein
MPKSAKYGTLGVHLRAEVVERIKARGAMLGLKKGTYAALILEDWLKRGEPPVSEPDRIIQIAQRQESLLLAAEDRAEYGKKSGR